MLLNCIQFQLIYINRTNIISNLTLNIFLCFPIGHIWDLSLGSACIPYLSMLGHKCERCGRTYKTKYTLRRHERLECGLPAQYQCKLCDYRAKHKHSLKHHFEGVHKKRFRQKINDECGDPLL